MITDVLILLGAAVLYTLILGVLVALMFFLLERLGDWIWHGK